MDITEKAYSKFKLNQKVYVAHRDKYYNNAPYIEWEGIIDGIHIFLTNSCNETSYYIHRYIYEEARVFLTLEECSKYVEEENNILGLKKENYYI